MQANRDKVESLHQQAAAYYLQGDFEKALQFWQQLLAVDAEDERAQEGVRLCEMLASEGDPPASIPVVASAPDAHIEQSAHGAARPAPVARPQAAAPAAPPAAQAAATAPAPAGFEGEFDDEDLEWDLSKLDLNAGQAAGPDATVPTPPLVDDDISGTPEFGGPEPVGADDGLAALDAMLGRSSGSVGSAASSELQARVQELVNDALRSYEAGDLDGAMSLLSRVFILDETNAAALHLQQVIEAETAPATGAEVGDDLDLDLSASEAPEPAAGVAPLDVLDGDERDPTDIPMEGIDDAEMAALDRGIPSGIREAQKQAAQADPGEPSSVGFLSRKVLAICAVGLLVAVAAGWGALQLIGGSADPALDEAVKQMQAVNKGADGGASGEATAGNDAAAQGREDGAEQSADASAPPAAALGADDLPALLARAKSLAEAGEFSQAIIAFNQALEIDPAHPVAKAGLASAGERYREQRDHEAKMASATSAWDSGDYAAALRIFYRLPAAATDPRFARYRRNGWYNLGVVALQSGECIEARPHFEEMRGEDPRDPQLPELTELAKACDYSRQDPEYQQRLRELTLRGMDDSPAR